MVASVAFHSFLVDRKVCTNTANKRNVVQWLDELIAYYRHQRATVHVLPYRYARVHDKTVEKPLPNETKTIDFITIC